MNKFIKILIFMIFSQSFICPDIYSMDPNLHNFERNNTELTEENIKKLNEAEILGNFYTYQDYWKNQIFNGKKLIHIAAQNGWAMLFNILICEGVNINALDNNRHTPLYLALVNKNFDIVKVMLRLDLVDTKITYNNRTILDIALQNPVSQEDYDIIQLIKEKDPSLYIANNTESLNTASSTVNYPDLEPDHKIKKNKSSFYFKKLLAITSISSLSAYLLYKFVNNNKKDTDKIQK